MKSFRYRADVDGLRAVAVVAVLLFHAGLGCTGGFVGVDIFFVISGFLITGLILSQQENEKFSLKQFWVRRIKRIVPASAAMVMATLLAGYFLLLPTDYVELARSTIWQQLFASNVFFWRHTGYFDSAAELKPLLHTWSLAVEEQFYFFYPVLLVLIGRFSQRQKCWVLALLTAGSFAVCCTGMVINPNATFFLLPTRAWEMSIGGLLCFTPEIRGRRTAQLMSASGLAAIAFCFLWYGHETAFPGVNALLPTFGALLIIHGNSHAQSTSVGSLLSAKPMVGIGLVSYSLYLWHWPIMAYYRYWFGAEMGISGAVLCLGLTAACALASYYAVESPLRHYKPTRQGHSRVFKGILATAPVALVLAAVIYVSNGVSNRLPQQAQAFDLAKESTQFTDETLSWMVEAGELSTIGAGDGQARVAVWGDSHAMSLVAGVDAACKELGLRGVRLTRSMTPPVLDFEVETKENFETTTSQFNASVLKHLQEADYDLVIMAGYWAMYEDDPEFARQFRATLETLDEAGVHYCIVEDVAAGPSSFPRLLAQTAWQGRSTDRIGTNAEVYAEQSSTMNELLDPIRDSGGIVLSPSEHLCQDDGFWPAQVGGISMYRDADHLSVDGSLRLKPMFLQVLGQLDRQLYTQSESASDSRPIR